jgi:two-component system sensor histidine kinase UhpB
VTHDPDGLVADPAAILRSVDDGSSAVRWLDAGECPSSLCTAQVLPMAKDEDLEGIVVFLDDRRLLRASRDRRAAIGETAARLSSRVLSRIRAEQEAHEHRVWLESRARERTAAWRELADSRRRAERTAEQRATEQMAAARLGQDVLAERDLNALIDTSLNLVSEVLNVEYVGYCETSEDGNLLLRAAVGWPAVDVGTLVLERRRSLSGYALEVGETVVSDDSVTEDRFDASLLVARGVRSGMAVLLMRRGAPCGVLNVFSSEQRRFSADDTGFLEIIANSLSFAIERDRARHELAAAEERERRRIGEGIHDDTLQRLAAIALRLDTDAMRSPDALAGSRLAKNAQELRDAADGLRTLAFQLHPEGLRRIGLPAALEQLVETAGRTEGFAVRVHLDESIELAEDHETVLYQVAKEALANVAKHAGAQHVELALREHAGTVTLRITDDGRGIDPDTESSPVGHLGLTTMRLRVEQCGGELAISPGHDAGTTVQVWLPTAGRAAA